eukprot:XP_001693117.1 alpha glucosidase [Chlamydomonas reinhardtii]
MLQVELQQQTPQRLYLRVSPLPSPGGGGAGGAATGQAQSQPHQERWRVPEQLLPRPPPPTALPEAPLYQLQLPQPGDDFSLHVTRQPESQAEVAAEAGTEAAVEAAAAGQSLLEVLGGSCLVFKPQYLQLRMRVPQQTNLYGMGEATLPDGLRLRRDGVARALWNSDTPAAAVGVNLYGSHPVLYGIVPGSGGTAWGVFLANSNAMEFAAGSNDVTFRLTGGDLELWLLAGPTPEDVSRQYLQLVGAPALPPRWALGFHQSRYGYADVSELEAVVAGFEAAQLPLEVLWSDIDMYDRARMFTTDSERYPVDRLRGLVDRLHGSGRRWVPIVDCGITALPGQAYPPYDRGLAAGVFLRDSGGRQPLLGQVWSGPTHWPDFLHPNTSEYWGGLLSDMAARLPYDGLWLDMNEPSNFYCGRAPGTPDDPLSYPPYAVNNGNRRAPLYVNTVPMNAVGYGGVRQYDSHNLYALAEVAVTHGALQAILPGSRPFILTRSTWAGSGRYAAHWSGDNGASWEDLARGGGSLLAASLAGISMAGADVCGFWGATSEQLCARWLAAGSFYTFTRDHSDHSPQEPYRFPAAAQAARNSLRARYALLPYLYTALYDVHTGRAGTVARPLAWEFPSDPRVADLSTQWLLGDSLLVAPVLRPDTDWTEAVFPAGARSTWCRLSDLGDCHTGPAQHLVQSPLGSEPPLFLRAGAIIPTQPFRPAATTTAEVAASPLALTALLSSASEASGSSSNSSSSGSAEGGGGPPAPLVEEDVDWVAAGRLYADNGTDPRVDGADCLRVELRAGALLAAGTGYLAYEVQRPPAVAVEAGSSSGRGSQGRGSSSGSSSKLPQDGTGSSSGNDSSSGGGGGGVAAGGGVRTAGGGADTDVRLLRVAEVVVVGVVLPPGAGAFEVQVEVGGQLKPPEQPRGAKRSVKRPGGHSLQSQSQVPRRLAGWAAAGGSSANSRNGGEVVGMWDGDGAGGGCGHASHQEVMRRRKPAQAQASARGARVPVPATAVEFDPVRQLLRVRGLELSAVVSFRLEWKPLTAPPHSTTGFSSVPRWQPEEARAAA